MDHAITIDQLRVKRARGNEALVAHQLELVAWPNPSREYLFLKQLSVRAPLRDLPHATSQRAAELAAQACDGASNAARDAAAVKFSSLADVIAHLSWDLVRGRAQSLWFWAAWKDLFAISRGEALERLWSRSILELPAVTTHLERLGGLRSCWEALSEDHAAYLTQSILARFGGGRAGSVRSSQHLDSATAPKQSEPLVERVPEKYLRRWRNAGEGSTQSNPRTRLAAVLILQEWRPTWLGPALREHALREVSTALASETILLDEAVPGDDSTNNATDARFKDSPEIRRAPKTQHGAQYDFAPKPVNADAGRANDAPLEPSSRTREVALQPAAIAQSPSNRGHVVDATTATSLETTSPAKAAHEDTRQTRQLETPLNVAPSSLNSEAWVTQRGGVFYLINFLDSAAAQAHLNNSPEALAFPSGWAWLYAFATALGWRPDPALSDFFTRSAELKQASELDALPPLPHLEQLLQLAKNRYEASGVWTPELFELPARVERTPGRIDVHIPMSCTRLEVRVTGLDVDPGFIPWLGCVVRFHYGIGGLA